MESGLAFEVKQHRYDAETEEDMQETRTIISGQMRATQYSSAHELFEELDTEMDGE